MMNDNNDLIMTQKINNDLKCLELFLTGSKELRTLGEMDDETYIKNLKYVMEHTIALKNANNRI